MGGFGSGRWYRWDTKDTTAEVRRLDVRALHRGGRLAPGKDSWWHWSDGGIVTIRVGVTALEGRALFLVLHYRSRRGQEAWENVTELVTLDWTVCRYGGWRPWFRCPVSVNGASCGRRVAIVYGAGKYFGCRHCYRLAYPSTREDAQSRALTQAQAIRVRLGGTTNMLAPFPPKPRGMHERTYMRLFWEAHNLEARYFALGGADTRRLDVALALYEGMW